MEPRDDQIRSNTAERFRGAGRALRLPCAVGGIAALGLALAACGSSDSDPSATLNTARIEKAIARSSLEQRGLHARVTCPNDVQQAKGLEFFCEASVGRVETDFVVTQTDGAGHVHYEAP